MNHERATALVERYFAGETTLAEEAALKDYFRTADPVAEELKPYAPLFGYWEREARITAPPARRRRRRLPRVLLALAAALLLLLVVRGVHRMYAPPLSDFPVAERAPAVDWSRHEIKDEEEAMRFLRTVLNTTSQHMTRGTAITLRELRKADQILH
ncbi:hypothetical protein GGR26_002626 [Lewinella marina]|uniref:Uncharacterized protein n=1 Tax=Neolewinella marina TaxID=438751 RepID=A0A2G0CD96_9BACT|nr:hypothetical protein [Neolewinella marina]NJB86849.1 hypothetical protein [Neolewinella marina]PHK97951.1 hypothetical protein CGL56_14150 [Neolewinella marina]